jgi:hypothetical protein
MRDINWFQKEIEPCLKGYEIKYKFFEKGDFGSLNQAEFNSKKIGGNIDFWGLGWLGIFIWNYETEEQLLNVLLEPHQKREKEEAFRKLLDTVEAHEKGKNQGISFKEHIVKLSMVILKWSSRCFIIV